MKRFLTLAFFVAISLSGFAQEYIPTPADIAHFFKTKTIIVLEDRTFCDYNVEMEELVPKVWKLTDYEFMPWSEAKNKLKDEKLSFLLLNKVAVDNDKSSSRYLFLSLLNGGKYRDIAAMPDICSVPVAYYSAKEESYVYKLGLLLTFLQNHVQLIKKDPSIAKKNIFLYYNKNIQALGDKTLYLLKEELDSQCRTEEQIKKLYNGKFKFVTKEDIEKAIEDKDNSVAFLHKVGPVAGKNSTGRCFKIIVGAADANFYYFDFHKVEPKALNFFLPSDFKKLNRKN